MKQNRVVALFLALAAAGCAGFGGSGNDASPVAPGRERLLEASRLFDSSRRAETTWAAACDQLARAEVVFLGETHVDRLTHDAELEFMQQLAARRGGKIALAMEMFERDVQPVLDDYLAGKIGEPEFLQKSRPWGNYRTDYRPLVEFAKAHATPVIASNIPADLRRKLARGGEEAWKALTESERTLVPERLIENSPEYWARVDNVTRGHGAMGMGGGAGGAGRLYDGQNLWDNTMADSIARQLARDGDRLVVHVNGGFHSEYGQGTVWQLTQRRPGVKVATVQIRTTGDLAAAELGAKPGADFVAVVEARARSENDGNLAVSVSREHPWRLRRPHGVSAPLPLLIWLCGDGQTAERAEQLLAPVVGDGAILITLEPNFPWLGADGSRRGRWFFPGEADGGCGLATAALGRLFELIERSDWAAANAIDPGRVVIAGEGAGATVALCAMRWFEHEKFAALAFAPAARDELETMALPLEPEPERPSRALTIVAPDAELEEWRGFSAADAALRVSSSIVASSDAVAAADAQQVDLVRSALGLAPLVESGVAAAIFDHAPPHADGLFTARLLARRARAAGLTQPPDLSIRAELFADGSRLPLSSGPFGGTTIVVVPDDASPEELAAWLALENPDVIQKRSRFHRLRIAQGSGDHSPLAVIQKLRAENPQRRDFLLVPARFCASEPELAALRDSLGPLAGELHLELRPGLGAELPVGK